MRETRTAFQAVSRISAGGNPVDSGACWLALGVTRTALLDLLDDAVQIGITGAKSLCEPVPAATGDLLAVRDHVELAGVTRSRDGVDIQALLDEGRETRDLGLVVPSRRAVDDFDLHSASPSAVSGVKKLGLPGL